MTDSPFYLYTSVGCHLCDKAEALLRETLGEAGYARVTAVEISDSDDLMATYGIRIPVLGATRADGQWCELGWPFGRADLEAFLRALEQP